MQRVNKFTYAFAAIIAVFIFIITSLLGGGAAVVHAATSTTTAFEQSDIMDDLKSGNIDLLQYPYDSTGVIKHPEIMTVVEYCYSARSTHRNNYGLYIYFYNPQGLNISTNSKANKITLGVKYSKDKDGYNKVDDYEKFDLQFCSKSTGDYRDLFYKFKVIDHKSVVDGKTIAERVNTNARRYDISEVELMTVGDRNATAYGVGGIYTFTGYAKGYGIDENAESTLACERKDLETITLDLAGVTDGVEKRTYWRSNSSSLGAHHQNQINSVFFAIDKTVLEKYGYTLQKIKAEWNEYKTRPVVVVDNKELYTDLLKYNGVQISDTYDKSRKWSLYDSDYYGDYQGENVGTLQHFNYTWNGCELLHKPTANDNYRFPCGEYISDNKDTLLPLLFYTGGISVDDYTLTADTLQAYFESYAKSFVSGKLEINGGHSYSADLFADNVDSGRTRGYNLREFDISNPVDLWQINSYNSTHNWFQKFIDYGFGRITTNDDYNDILPIQCITENDLIVKDVANHLLINPDDVKTLKDYYNSVKKDCEVFIFRYAQTDYWATDLMIQNSDCMPTTLKGEVRQGTQFFDFDILQMTFNKNGVYTTLGCVSSPVDHWSDYTPSIEAKGWVWNIWKILGLILGLLILIVIIILLYPIISPILGFIVRGILWVILLPFRAIGALFKGIGKAANKRKRGK